MDPTNIALISSVFDATIASLSAIKLEGKLATAMLILRVILESALKVPMIINDRTLLKPTVESVLEKLVNGADGVNGTTDDLISTETAEKIRVLMSDQMISATIDLVSDALHGNLVGVAASSAAVASGCLSAFCIRAHAVTAPTAAVTAPVPAPTSA